VTCLNGQPARQQGGVNGGRFGRDGLWRVHATLSRDKIIESILPLSILRSMETGGATGLGGAVGGAGGRKQRQVPCKLLMIILFDFYFFCYKV